MDKSKKYIIDSKIEEIQSILSYLEKECGLNFIFASDIKKVGGNTSPINLSTSTEMSENFIQNFLNQINYVFLNRAKILSLLQKGFTVVRCIDNKNKPENVSPYNWIEQNNIYIVGEIVTRKHFGSYYRLQSRDGNLTTTLFEVERFEKYVLEELLN